MNLRAKGYMKDWKKTTGDKLASRIAALKEKGLDDAGIQRDTLIKKLKADIRKANYRLAAIAAQEKLNADKVQVKADKLAAKDQPPAKPAKGAKDAPAKKEKKEKKKASPPPADDKA